MIPMQCKLARTALGLGVRELAQKVGVSPDTIARFERGETLKAATVESIRSALEAQGIAFIPENGGGAGIRVPRSAGPDQQTIASGDLNASNDE